MATGYRNRKHELLVYLMSRKIFDDFEFPPPATILNSTLKAAILIYYEYR